jgi:peptide/nickel transport system substrate-binding protein
MDDMVLEDGVVTPVVSRPQVSAISKKLRATLSGWDGTFWDLKELVSPVMSPNILA